MFTRIAPQVAEDSEGFRVQVADRYTVEYVGKALRAQVEVDFGVITTIYPKTLKAHRTSGGSVSMSADEAAEVLRRIQDGLTCLGVRYEMAN